MSATSHPYRVSWVALGGKGDGQERHEDWATLAEARGCLGTKRVLLTPEAAATLRLSDLRDEPEAAPYRCPSTLDLFAGDPAKTGGGDNAAE